MTRAQRLASLTVNRSGYGADGNFRMNDKRAIITATVSDPAWLPHRYDPGHDAIHFVRADRPLRHGVAFLTDANLPGVVEPIVLARRDALSVDFAQSPVSFIFHSAFCCSTLLANAMDVNGLASSLKEPQILNDLVGWRHRGGDPKQISEVLDASLRLLARPFERAEAVVIKPSNVINGLASAILRLRPDAQAIFMYTPLRSFLASIARKGMWGRLWVRELLSRQLLDNMIDLGMEPRDHLLQTDLQIAAVGWLAQHQLFSKLSSIWPDRLRTLNADLLVDRPMDTLAAAFQHFGMNVSGLQLSTIVEAEFSRNAKDGNIFHKGQRAAERQAGELVHAEEIEKVEAWALAVASTVSLDLSPPNAL